MMGDDTWMQLAQHAFAEAYPYPSFNVHDLHTVDDGVWEVRAAARQPVRQTGLGAQGPDAEAA